MPHTVLHGKNMSARFTVCLRKSTYVYLHALHHTYLKSDGHQHSIYVIVPTVQAYTPLSSIQNLLANLHFWELIPRPLNLKVTFP